MKKVLLIVVATACVFLCFWFVFGRETTKTIHLNEGPTDFKEWAKWAVEQYPGTTVTDIVINRDTAPNAPFGKYIALIYADCEKGDRNKLTEYADGLFRYVYEHYPEYQEFVIFWNAKNYGTTIKTYNERSATVYSP